MIKNKCLAQSVYIHLKVCKFELRIYEYRSTNVSKDVKSKLTRWSLQLANLDFNTTNV